MALSTHISTTTRGSQRKASAPVSSCLFVKASECVCEGCSIDDRQTTSTTGASVPRWSRPTGVRGGGFLLCSVVLRRIVLSCMVMSCRLACLKNVAFMSIAS
eukprot:352507-Chlamydomonas_euryale.AAC.20